ncbi:MAG: hypothetical protein NZ992_06745, partial [Candidatus Korarchaeum sp.]|nr:hypothetical protein [Candidatus Korarchaeum sp.]MDW8035699.1 hypothetical protein [Candidatus Korarchaeum sp.]
SSFYFQKMDDIWSEMRRIEVLRNEILYLKNKADQYREAVAPLVLRLFSYSEEGDELSILYSGREIWRGRPADLKITYDIEGFRSVRIRREDSRVVASIAGMPYNYTLKTFYHEELTYIVREALNNARRLDKAALRDEEELARLEAELTSFTKDPLAAVFSATPLISAALQYAFLRRTDPEVGLKYASLLRNPYILLLSLALYLSFLSATLTLHSGVLMPLHVIAVLYILTSIPSLISPLLFAYEKIIE